MSYTITITEQWEEETDAAANTEEIAVLRDARSRQIYSQTVDALDLAAVLKAVNGMGKRTRRAKGRGAS